MAISANTPGSVSLVLPQLPVPLVERRLPGTRWDAHPPRHLKESQELPCLLIISLSPDFISHGYLNPGFGSDLELSLNLYQAAEPSFLCFRLSQ